MSERSSETRHVPVLPQESLAWLQPQRGQLFADGTLGGGGHTRMLAEAVGATGTVVALDRDPAAIERAEKALRGLPVLLTQANFADLPEVLEQVGIARVHGILLDLGLSSDQLADDARGFSFQNDGPLDLRFDPGTGKPAWQLIERMSAEHLADVIFQYGEERYSRRVARAICQQRRAAPIRTAGQLAAIVRGCLPPVAKKQKIDPATRTFQALRIAVNQELKWLETALRRLPDCLLAGGRLVVISFHSLEDRLVKNAFRHDQRLEILTRKPVIAAEDELARNPRARSAKLRVAARR